MLSVKGRKMSPKLPIFLVSSHFFEDFAFPCQNSAHIGILPSKIGFAFPLSRLVLLKRQGLEIWSLMHPQSTIAWMHMDREFKLSKLTTTATVHTNPNTNTNTYGQKILNFWWNETSEINVEDLLWVAAARAAPHLHVFEDKCALQRQFPANSNLAGFLQTFQ